MMELSALLLVSSPVALLAALVIFLFTFTAAEAKKQTEGRSEANILREENKPTEVISAIVEDLSESYHPIPDE